MLTSNSSEAVARRCSVKHLQSAQKSTYDGVSFLRKLQAVATASGFASITGRKL